MNNNYNGYYPYQNYYPNMNRSIPGMNFYNTIPTATTATRGPGFLARLLNPSLSAAAPGIAGATRTFSFSGLLNGASKTLGVINQAIPVFYQVKPIWNNAKTMFRVAKELRSTDNISSITNSSEKITQSSNTNSSSNKSGPTFFQ